MKYLRKLLLPLIVFCVLFTVHPERAQAAAKTNVITTARKVSGGTWVTGSKGIRYRTASGKYLKNTWVSISGKVYRLDEKGYCETGWFTYNGASYYADQKGRVYYKKWYTGSEGTYYLAANGTVTTSKWIKRGDAYYYLTANGKMAVNQLVGLYFVNASGARVTSQWVRKDGKFYYFGKDGKSIRNTWVSTSKGFCYLGSTGARLENSWVGKYYVGEDGLRVTNCIVGGYWLNAAGARTVKVFRGTYIIVGDSRTVGMENTVSASDTLFIGEVGSGYTWLKDTAGVQLKYYLDANPNVKVIFAHGVNDLGNIDLYLAYYKELIAEYPKTEFYMLSVNPVNDQYIKKHKPTTYSYLNNAAIQKFNKKVKAAFGNHYLNSYSYLVKNGFSATDGIHYTADTYKTIYTYITVHT
jgi:glucan-binding YG repeat protein